MGDSRINPHESARGTRKENCKNKPSAKVAAASPHEWRREFQDELVGRPKDWVLRCLGLRLVLQLVAIFPSCCTRSLGLLAVAYHCCTQVARR